METWLAIASRREIRDYDQKRSCGDEDIAAVVDAGRVSGSARNRQNWRFIATSDRSVLDRIAPCLTRPSNLATAGAAVAVCITADSRTTLLDAGRAVQNMLLRAHDLGLGSCPNAIADPAELTSVLGLHNDEEAVIVLSLGWPARPTSPQRQSAAAWSQVADRHPLAEVLRTVSTSS